MPKPATIAIDGPGAVGKSAIGSLLAQRLGYRFMDTGAMYRALTWLALYLKIDPEDAVRLSNLAAEAPVSLSSDTGRVAIRDHDVTAEPLADRLLYEGQLLHRVKDIGTALGDAQVVLQLGIGQGHYARRSHAAQIYGYPVGLL